MTYKHQQLASGQWKTLSLIEQLANIGSEIGRTINWKPKNAQMSQQAFFRALELIDLTITDPKNKTRLKEICRTRECLVDHFFGDNIYKSTDQQWEKYFHAFNYAARNKNNSL